MLLHPGDVAKHIANGAHTQDPQQGPDDIERSEALSRHMRHTGDKRCEGTNERQKTRGDDGDAAVFLVKSMSLFISTAVEKPGIALK